MFQRGSSKSGTFTGSIRATYLSVLWTLATGTLSITRATPLVAAEPTRSQVLVRVANADDEALLERVRGQVSDLDIDLEVVQEQPAADASGSKVIVWFTRPDSNADRVVVHAMQSGSDRTLVREIGDGAPTESGALSSGTLEAAALIVREALRELTAREPAASTAQPLPESSVRVVAASMIIKTPDRSRISYRGQVDWTEVLDGVAAFRRQGPTFMLGGIYREFELSLFAGSSLPASESDAHGVIRLRRHVFGVRGGHQWRLTRTFETSLGLRAGAALYARSAEALQTDVTPNGSHLTVSGLIGPELRIGWAPSAGPIEFTLTSGLDFVLGAPRIGYQVKGQFSPSFEVWRLQPTFGIGVAFRSDSGS